MKPFALIFAAAFLAALLSACGPDDERAKANEPRVITGPENGTDTSFRDPLLFPEDSVGRTTR
jgi:hypothetical protein